jgi:hypothetical protein
VATDARASTSLTLRALADRLHELCGGLRPREVASDQGIEARFRQHRLFL